MEVAPFEAQIRDDLAANPWPLIESCLRFEPDYAVIEGARCYREFPTAAGFIDLLILVRGFILIVEVNRHRIDERAVAQCLRYKGAFRDEFHELDYLSKTKILGVLVAPSITLEANWAIRGAEDFRFYRALAIEPGARRGLPSLPPTPYRRSGFLAETADFVDPGFRERIAGLCTDEPAELGSLE